MVLMIRRGRMDVHKSRNPLDIYVPRMLLPQAPSSIDARNTFFACSSIIDAMCACFHSKCISLDTLDFRSGLHCTCDGWSPKEVAVLAARILPFSSTMMHRKDLKIDGTWHSSACSQSQHQMCTTTGHWRYMEPKYPNFRNVPWP